jgi:hypothetical protein
MAYDDYDDARVSDQRVDPQDSGPADALKRDVCVTLEPRIRKIGNLTVLPYRAFLAALWAGEYR